MPMHDETTRDHGLQPLDLLMQEWGLDNHLLVEGCEEQLTHKQVQRARKGRQLTLHSMQKITRALNATLLAMLSKEAQAGFVPYLHRQLFNYAKGHDVGWQDPNSTLKPGKN